MGTKGGNNAGTKGKSEQILHVGATLLTCWGSEVQMLTSILHNRVITQTVLRRFLDEQFSSSAFNCLAFVWNISWGKEAEPLLEVAQHVRNFIQESESDRYTLFEAVEQSSLMG